MTSHTDIGEELAESGLGKPLVKTEISSATAAGDGKGNGILSKYYVVLKSLTNVKVPI